MPIVFNSSEVTPENLYKVLRGKYGFELDSKSNILMRDEERMLYMVQVMCGGMLRFTAIYYLDNNFKEESLDRFCSEACDVSIMLRVYYDCLETLTMDFPLYFDQSLSVDFLCRRLDEFLDEVDSTLYLFREKFHLR